MEGAFLHVLADLLGSVAVVGAALLILGFGWFVADPIFGIVIGVLILMSSGPLLRKVLRVLMEGTPARLEIQRLCQRLEQVEGVTGVHDIHAWSIVPGYEVMSAHVTADLVRVEASEDLLRRLREVTTREFGVAHITLQIEGSMEECEESHHLPHPPEQ